MNSCRVFFVATWPIDVAKFVWGEYMMEAWEWDDCRWLFLFVVVAISDGRVFVFVFMYERLRVVVTCKLCSYGWGRDVK